MVAPFFLNIFCSAQPDSPVETVVSQTPEAGPEPVRVPAVSDLPHGLAEKLRLLDAWSNGETLSQEIVNALRKPVFDSVQARINWDAELLVEGFFCGAGRLFKRTSVNFHRQNVQKTQAFVQLTIPLDASAPNAFTDAALALQGLLLAAHYKGWHFRYGNRPGSFYLRCCAAQLERWAVAVLAQLRKPHGGETPWDPAPAAAELLALAARMANRPVASRTTTDTQLNALFQGLDGVSVEHRSPAWKELFTALRDQQATLVEIIYSHTACTKGGSRRVQVLDACRFVKPLLAVRQDYQPRADVPEQPWEPYAVLMKLREKVGALLRRAVDEERAWLLDWQERVVAEIGREKDWAGLLDEVRAAIGSAQQDLGLAGGGYDKLIAAVDDVRSKQLTQCFESIEKLRSATDLAAVLIELGRDHAEVITAVDNFIALSKEFLGKYEPRVESDIAQLKGAGELKSIQTEIASGFDALHTLLGNIQGGQA